MTPLAPTFPEPLCDLEAQLAALADPANPRRAVWVSADTPLALARARARASIYYFGGAGVLLTADPALARRLEAEPSEEVLAGILGYTMPKSAIPGVPQVVQALAGECVLWEQLVSAEGVWEARLQARRYGSRVRVYSMLECLRRRRRLIAEEGRAREEKAAAAPGPGAVAS